MKEEATLENYDAKFEQAIRGLAKELAEYADVTYEQVMRLGEQTIYLLWHELHGYDPVCDEPPYEKIRRYVADDEEVSYFDDYIAEREKELKEIRENWKPEKEPNMDEEIKLIKNWVKEREDFINN